MAQEIPVAWSPADELKLIKGLKEKFSFDALSAVIGHSVENVQRKCISLDLYQAVYENVEDLSQITLIPKSYISVACASSMHAHSVRELIDLGWVEQVHRGVKSLRSPEWWVNGPSFPFRRDDDLDDVVTRHRPFHHLNQGKPWTPDELNHLLEHIKNGTDKEHLTRHMLRSMNSIIQHMSLLGIVRIGADENSGEARAWLSPGVAPRVLIKMRYYDVFPLLSHGWIIFGDRLKAPAWWKGGCQLNELVKGAWHTQHSVPPNITAAQPLSPPSTLNKLATLAANMGYSTELNTSDPHTASAGTNPESAVSFRQLTAPLQSGTETRNPSQPPLQSQPDKSTPGEQQEPARNGSKWFAGNYKFMLTLLKEHHDPDTIAKKMDRSANAITSRLQHIGIVTFAKNGDNPNGRLELAIKVSIDKLRKQPAFVKEQLVNAGWMEKERFFIAPDWWKQYPHTLK